MRIKTSLVLVLISIYSFFHCSRQPTKDNAKQKTYLYESKSGATYRVQFRSDSAIVRLSSPVKLYRMKQSRSASGARFADEADHVFWIKGDEFYFFRKDSLLDEGSLRKTLD